MLSLPWWAVQLSQWSAHVLAHVLRPHGLRLCSKANTAPAVTEEGWGLSRWVGVGVGVVRVTTERSGPIFWGVAADIAQLSTAQS